MGTEGKERREGRGKKERENGKGTGWRGMLGRKKKVRKKK